MDSGGDWTMLAKKSARGYVGADSGFGILWHTPWQITKGKQRFDAVF